MSNRISIQLAVILVGVSVLAMAPPVESQEGPIVRQAVRHDTSGPLRDQAVKPREPFIGEPQEVNPLGVPQKVVQTGPSRGSERLPQPNAPDPAPSPSTSFSGIGATGFIPPDTVGDVGIDYYVQAVNSEFAVFDKTTGAVELGPFDINSLFDGFGGICESNNNGDPVVLYDSTNSRWLITQFAFRTAINRTAHQCFAVSTTSDPTGSWHRYDFLWSNTVLNDYPHFGIWPDGLFMAANQFTLQGLNWAGQGVAAFEWAKMLNGQVAQMVYFDLFSHNPDFGGMIPTDWDGAGAPPPAGRNGLFVEWDDATWIAPTDALRFWEFDVDWNNTANSTFGVGLDPNFTLNTLDVDPEMCGFARNCIPQPTPATSNSYLDAIADRLLHRMAYRNMGTHEALVGNHTVDSDGTDHAGIHWLEVRNPFGTPFIQQENVWAPDANHRWMGSIAMDEEGNIALGYSVSSTSTFPSIRYTGRLAGDALGTLRAEQSAFAGGGVQTSTSGRWGDYSSMNIDPDEVTFWYTQEYYESTSSGGWSTGVVSFSFSPKIFRDGFESGDVSSWTGSTP